MNRFAIWNWCTSQKRFWVKVILSPCIQPAHSSLHTYNSQKPPPTSISRNRAERSRLSTILLGIVIVCKKILRLPLLNFRPSLFSPIVLLWVSGEGVWKKQTFSGASLFHYCLVLWHLRTYSMKIRHPSYNLYFCERVLKIMKPVCLYVGNKKWNT